MSDHDALLCDCLECLSPGVKLAGAGVVRTSEPAEPELVPVTPIGSGNCTPIPRRPRAAA